MNRKIKTLSIALVLLLLAFSASAQSVGINTDNSTPDASAILDVKSTSQGMLVPRMNTTQRTAISSPATGLMVYDTDLKAFYFHNGTAWAAVGGSSSSGATLLVRASANTAQTLSFGSNTAAPDPATCFGNVSTNVGSAFNATTGVFTAPSAGLYLITIQAVSTSSVHIFPYLDVDNDFVHGTATTSSTDFFGVATINSATMSSSANNRGVLTAQVYLNAGQLASIKFQTGSSAVQAIIRTDGATNFTVVKL